MESAFLSQEWSHFYGGADDNDPPTCFTANSPLCAVCRVSDAICQESSDNNYTRLLTAVISNNQNFEQCRFSGSY